MSRQLKAIKVNHEYNENSKYSFDIKILYNAKHVSASVCIISFRIKNFVYSRCNSLKYISGEFISLFAN